MSGLTFQDNQHVIAKFGDNYKNFQAARQDMGSVANKQFNAWLASDGSYIIMERDLTDTNDITTKYFHSKDRAAGRTFATDWADRAGLTYEEYNEMFS